MSERTGDNDETYYVNTTNIEDDYIEVAEINHKSKNAGFYYIHGYEIDDVHYMDDHTILLHRCYELQKPELAGITRGPGFHWCD